MILVFNFELKNKIANNVKGRNNLRQVKKKIKNGLSIGLICGKSLKKYWSYKL